MLSTVVFALCTLAAFTQAQDTYRCECALFSQSQHESDRWPDNVAALYGTWTEVEPYWCTSPEGGTLFHPCKDFCTNWFGNVTEDGFNYCTRAPGEIDRCYGGLMCEVIYNDGITGTVDGDAVRLFYRIPECPDAHKTWVQLGEQLPTALCCEEGLYEPCYGFDCECYKGENRGYCECGVFTPEQIEATGGLTGLPFHYVGNMTEDFEFGYCLDFGSPDENADPCRENCEDTGTDFFRSYRLNQYPPGITDFTYGEGYCAGLKNRYVGDFPGVQTSLQVYQRAPDCPTVGWLLVPDVEHPETLCCNTEGEHIYPCVLNNEVHQ